MEVQKNSNLWPAGTKKNDKLHLQTVLILFVGLIRSENVIKYDK